MRAKHPGLRPSRSTEVFARHDRAAGRHEAARRWAEALPHLDAMIAAEAGHDDTLLRRGRALARLGRWRDAAADYARVVDIRPIHDESTEYACLLLLLGDHARYRDFCRTLLDRSGEPPDPLEDYVVARTGALAPGGVSDPSVLARRADRAISNGLRTSWTLHASGLASLRAGNLDRAIARLHESQETEPGWPGRWQNTLALALAESRSGRPAQARELREEAVRQLGGSNREESSVGPVCPPDMHLADWLESRVLLGEIGDQHAR